jgi:RNA-binding protein Musashi
VDRVLAVPAHTLNGRKIDPKHATPKNNGKVTSSSKTRKVFVGGVSQDTSADEVEDYFNQFGHVEEAVMLMDQQTKRHRGFGFVTFESENVVDRICEIHYHMIKDKKVECKKAQPKEAILASNTSALLAAKHSVLLNGFGVAGLALEVAHVQQSSVIQVAALHFLATQAAQVQAAVVAHQQQAALAQSAVASAGYGKLVSSYPPLSSYRYSPYSLPGAAQGNVQAAAAAAAMAAASSGHHHHYHAMSTASTATQQAAAYQGYNLANVDMSSFQGVDWSQIYGMGMYV